MLKLGMTRTEFFERYFERAPRLCPQALLTNRPGWDDVDALLQQHEPDDALLQLFLDGPVGGEHYVHERREQGHTQRVIDPQRFFSLLYRGATLVLNRLENRHTLSRRLCDEVGRFTGIQTSCNSYVTWTNPATHAAGAFGKHWDTHDVFVVQLLGRKSWRVYPPTLPWPLAQHTSRNSNMTCPPRPHMECVLEAGDVLYIPRGWWHEVTAMNTGSWHLSIGVYTPTMTDYLSWLCQSALSTLPEARRGVLGAPTRDELNTMINHLLHAARNPLSFNEFEQHLHRGWQPHGELNTALLMPDAPAWQDERIRVARALPCTINIRNGVVPTPQGALPLTTVQHDIVAILNQVTDLPLSELLQQLGNYPADAIRHAVRQLSVLQVISLLMN